MAINTDAITGSIGLYATMDKVNFFSIEDAVLINQRVPGYPIHYPVGYPVPKLPGNPSTNVKAL
jgi:hypothetical protein